MPNKEEAGSPAGAGLQVHTEVSGEGPPVLLLHGIPGSGAVWGPTVELLVEAGCQTISCDLLGFGQSVRPESDDGLWIGAQVDALTRMLDQLAVGTVAVAGHDYGAPIAVVLADRHPERVSHLVLASGNLFCDTPIPPPLSAVSWPVAGSVVARILMSGPGLRLMLARGVARDDVRPDPRIYLGDRSQQRSIRRIFEMALRELSSRYAPVEAALGRLRQPTVVLWGDRDPFFSVEQGGRSATAIPGARLGVLGGVGHFLPTESPDAFRDALVELIQPAGGSGT